MEKNMTTKTKQTIEDVAGAILIFAALFLVMSL